MTINYLDSKRLQWLSTDEMSPTFEENFSTYTTQGEADAVWSTNDTARMRVNVTTDVFDWISTRNGIASTSNKNVGYTISDTNWVLKFRYRMTSSNNNDARLFVGFSSTTGNYGATMDWLGIIIPNPQHTQWSITGYDNAALTIGDYSSFYYTPLLNTDYYIKLSRISATALQLDVYSDSAYTSLLGTVSRTILSTITGLGYLKICNMNNDSAGYSMSGIIDDIKFWNGVPNKPTNVQTNSIFEQTDTNTRHWYNGTNWITQPTFEDDFSSYANQASADASWVSNDTTNLRVNITNDNMFSTNSNAGSTIMKNMYYDLTSVSDTAWVLRFKSTLSSFTARTDTNTQYSNITISSSTADASTAQDWMGLTWNTHTGLGNIYDVGGKDNTAISQFNGTYFTKVLSSGETLYVELIRNGANITANLFSDSGYTTLVETRTNTTTGTITGLRYLKSTIRKTVTGSNGTINLLLDDIKFYNGVTSV